MLQNDARSARESATNGRSPIRDRTRDYSMYCTSRIQNPRSPYQLHSTQSEKAFTLEGWMACIGNVDTQEIRETFPLCSTHGNRRYGERNYDCPAIEKNECVKGPGVTGNLAGASPATTFLAEKKRIRCSGGACPRQAYFPANESTMSL